MPEYPNDLYGRPLDDIVIIDRRRSTIPPLAPMIFVSARAVEQIAAEYEKRHGA